MSMIRHASAQLKQQKKVSLDEPDFKNQGIRSTKKWVNSNFCLRKQEPCGPQKMKIKFADDVPIF
jgi:hypothetical protein